VLADGAFGPAAGRAGGLDWGVARVVPGVATLRVLAGACRASGRGTRATRQALAAYACRMPAAEGSS